MAQKRMRRPIEELMENPDTEWHYEFECEHEGDVDREVCDLEDSGAVKDIKTSSSPHGDEDYYTTVYFKVVDYDKFEKYFGYPVWEGANTYDMWYWADEDEPVKESWCPVGRVKR